MYLIKLNRNIVAVSSTIESAMRASRKLIEDYAGIRNPNCVQFPSGIQFYPDKEIALADVIVDTYDNKETIRVFITKVLVV